MQLKANRLNFGSKEIWFANERQHRGNNFPRKIRSLLLSFCTHA